MFTDVSQHHISSALNFAHLFAALKSSRNYAAWQHVHHEVLKQNLAYILQSLTMQRLIKHTVKMWLCCSTWSSFKRRRSHFQGPWPILCLLDVEIRISLFILVISILHISELDIWLLRSISKSLSTCWCKCKNMIYLYKHVCNKRKITRKKIVSQSLRKILIGTWCSLEIIIFCMNRKMMWKKKFDICSLVFDMIPTQHLVKTLVCWEEILREIWLFYEKLPTRRSELSCTDGCWKADPKWC